MPRYERQGNRLLKDVRLEQELPSDLQVPAGAAPVCI